MQCGKNYQHQHPYNIYNTDNTYRIPWNYNAYNIDYEALGLSTE